MHMVLFQKRPMITLRRQLKPELQLRFLQQLAKVLTNGYSLLSALETLKWDRSLALLAENTINKLKNGIGFDKALEELKFNPLITTYLYFSKDYGDLEENISKCVGIYEKRLHYYRQFGQAIRYPLILLVVFTMMFFFIQHSVIPNLLTLAQQGTENAILIKLSITVVTVCYYTFIICIFLILLCRIIWQYLKLKVPIETQLIFLKLLPFYRSYLKLNTSFLFATHISSLLKSGLSIKDVLAILEKQSRLPLLSYYSSLLTKGLNQGIPISFVITNLFFINSQLAKLFQKNANTELLEKDLTIYAAMLIEQLNQRILKAITYIQPIFFILLGIMIILIYLSLIWPMYQIFETI